MIWLGEWCPEKENPLSRSSSSSSSSCIHSSLSLVRLWPLQLSSIQIGISPNMGIKKFVESGLLKLNYLEVPFEYLSFFCQCSGSLIRNANWFPSSHQGSISLLALIPRSPVKISLGSHCVVPSSSDWTDPFSTAGSFGSRTSFPDRRTVSIIRLDLE